MGHATLAMPPSEVIWYP